MESTTQTEVTARTDTTPEPRAPQRERAFRAPRVDVAETDEAVLLAVDVPGVSMDGIDLTVEGDRLDLVARRTDHAPDGHRVALRQFGEFDYRRTFRLSEAIDRGAVHADLRNGVLRITLAKVKPAKPRTVRVQVA